jgi:hypothetical protein
VAVSEITGFSRDRHASLAMTDRHKATKNSSLHNLKVRAMVAAEEPGTSQTMCTIESKNYDSADIQND